MEETEEKYTDQLIELSTKIENGGWDFFTRLPGLDERYIDFDSDWLNEIIFKLESEIVERVDYSAYFLKNRLKALLYEMKQLAKKQNTVLSQFEQNLHSFFSILYGMCSSQLSFIFNAFTGASLARILS